MTFSHQLLCGNALTVLQGLPAGIVQMCCTSPPYYGLRDYQTESQIWDGNPLCEHEWVKIIQKDQHGDDGLHGQLKGGHATQAQTRIDKRSNFCTLCTAWRGSLGLEPTPDLYVAHLVQIFRGVKRVLRDDGTLWLNLGDSYGHGTSASRQQSTNPGVGANRPEAQNSVGRNGIQAKQLLGIPWRVAFALQADGWYLRQEIIWNKPNCTPESVEDRPTTAHEHLFLLAKSEKYYYDGEAIKEPAIKGDAHAGARNYSWIHNLGRIRASQTESDRQSGRNKRSVWTIPTRSYAEAHFATFPPKLIEPCILAGSRPGDIVLDPFIGAGTTALVALQYGRDYLGIDLSPAYLELARRRIETIQPNMWAAGGVA